MSDQVRARIFGTDFMGDVQAPAARADKAAVAAIADSAQERAQHALVQPEPEDAARVSDLIARDDNLVHIFLPNRLHASLAEKTLGLGTHVVCKKPLAAGLASAASSHAAGWRALAIRNAARVVGRTR